MYMVMLFFYFPSIILFNLTTAMNANKKTFTVIPGLNMGLFSPKELAQIVAIINKYDVPMTKITSTLPPVRITVSSPSFSYFPAF